MYRCCQLNYLMQIMSENLFRQYHRRKASTALNLFHVCYRKRLISKEKFMLNPLYTFPKKYELSTDINSLYNQMNQDWEIDFTPSIMLKRHACLFVVNKDKLNHQDRKIVSIFFQ